MKKFCVSQGFVHGFSRALDLNGTKKWPDITDGRKTDREALRRDWCYVGDTIRREAKRYNSAQW